MSLRTRSNTPTVERCQHSNITKKTIHWLKQLATIVYRGTADPQQHETLHQLIDYGNTNGHVASLANEELDTGVGILWDTVCDNLKYNSFRLHSDTNSFEFHEDIQ